MHPRITLPTAAPRRRAMLRTCSVLLLLAQGIATGCVAQGEAPGVTRVRDVIYHKKGGVALTMDVFKPEKPSGVGVLWMVSGGWFSSHDNINAGIAQPFLKRGQTVFQIVHGSQPKYAIQEIREDIDRATRFVRAHAAEYGVDPDRIGIAGGSAGGHLSLTQGARGVDGDPNAKDPMLKVSSRVQAVACFFPPTDFLNYGEPGRNALTVEELKPFRAAFGNKTQDAAEVEAVARDISPITFTTKAMPPTLIIHGDADKLVPIQQAEAMMKKLEQTGTPHKLIVKAGQAHGWPDLIKDVDTLAEWFDHYMPKK